MDEDQQLAVNLANQGHNILLTGQGGSGKTYIVKEIVKILRERGKRVHITSSTGISATHYGNLGAITLHKFAGIQDGRYTNNEILHLVQSDERFQAARQRITNTDVLIVDEISMISSKVLSQVEFLCREIKGNKICFGNIQVILVGDFYQLPPISNENYGDYGHHCYEAKWFDKMFPHKIMLNQIHRQDERELILAVNSLEKGLISDEITAFLHSLSRPLPEAILDKAIHLFPRNLEADIFNYEKLTKLPGEMVTFSCQEEGDQQSLSRMLAPKYLGLKPSCSVMLLVNLSDTLVNGLIGTVKKINETSIDVDFVLNDQINTVNVGRHTFTTFDPVEKITLAKRIQYPLKLSYGITIHKAQGMSLDSVVIHCDHIGFPGQLGVAIGRATNVEGLQVIGFQKKHCKSQPNKVKQFYESIQIGVLEVDLTCCQRYYENELDIGQDQPDTTGGISNSNDNDDDDDNDDDKDDDKQDKDDDGKGKSLDSFNEEGGFMITENEDDPYFSDNDEEWVNMIDTMIENSDGNEEIINIMERILSETMREFSDTPAETYLKGFSMLLNVSPMLFTEWLKKQLQYVKDMSSSVFQSAKTAFTSKQINAFYTKFNQYLNSDNFKGSVTELLSYYSKASDTDHSLERQFFTSIMFNIQKNHFQEISSQVKCQPSVVLRTLPEVISPAGRGKIRYVGGYAIAKVKYHHSKLIRKKLFNPKQSEETKQLRTELSLLEGVCLSEAEISVVTSDKESLEEIKRRQNIREGLTNITDKLYSFFTELEIACVNFLSYENLVKYKANLFQALSLYIYNNREIIESWVNVFRDTSIDFNSNVKDTNSNQDIVQDICLEFLHKFESIITLMATVCDLFMKVCIGQFRKDYLQHLKKEKGVALRKKVMQKTVKTVKKLDMNFLLQDESEGKNASHYRLKSEIIVNENLFKDSTFTKVNLQLLGKAYGVKFLLKMKKPDMAEQLISTIKGLNSMPFPNILQKTGSSLAHVDSESSDVVQLNQTNPISDTDPNPIPTILDPMPSTSSDPLQSTSSDPMQSTSSDPMQSTSSDPMPSTSSDPMQSTSSDPMPSTSSDPMQSTSSDPMQSTSSDPMPSTSSDPMQSTSSDPIQSTSSDPMQSTSSETLPSTSDILPSTLLDHMSSTADVTPSTALNIRKSTRKSKRGSICLTSYQHNMELQSDVHDTEVSADSTTALPKKGKSKRTSNKGKGPAKKKGLSKRKKTKKDVDESCSLCDRVYVEGSGEDWILCDTCDSWFDRHCSGLDLDELWNHFTQDDIHFDCPLCQKGNGK